MNLFESLALAEPLHAAVIGGGGKTTALFQLASQVKGQSWVTTTTHLGTDQLQMADRHFILRSPADIAPDLWKQQKVTLLTGGPTQDDRMRGPEPEILEQIAHLARVKGISLLVEADGARSHPLKAPAEHEPVIPAWADTVVLVIGLSVLGKPLTAEWVHRPERFSQLSGIPYGQPVSLDGIISMLLNPLGGLKGTTREQSKVVLFNQSDTQQLQIADFEKMHRLMTCYDKVLVASLQCEPDNILSIIQI